MRYFATTAKGLELLLVEELNALGATTVQSTVGGVSFEGDLSIAYQACLWSRLANHILMPLFAFEAVDQTALYDAVQQHNWADHLSADSTLRIDVVGNHQAINHTRFIAQKMKDAIVDQLRTPGGQRPSVQLETPDIAIYVYVKGKQFEVSLSLSGESLHKRGYRLESGRAPLKETLAAAILMRAGWEAQHQSDSPCLIDPMCGSGTLLIEAAMMAYDIAPGLKRPYFGFLGWKGHQRMLWQQHLNKAHQRFEQGLQRPDIEIRGYDSYPRAIEIAMQNIERAGLAKKIQVHVQDVKRLNTDSLHHQAGLIVTNPPYGERLQHGEESRLLEMFTAFGAQLQQHFQGWELAIITSNPDHLKALGIRCYKRYQLYNGPLEAGLLKFHIQPEYFMKHESAEEKLERIAENCLANPTPGSEMFANRLKKNTKHLRRWAEREQIECYRLYDADLPEYAAAIDRYGDWIYLQEYQAGSEIDPKIAKQRLYEMVAQVHHVLDIPYSNIILKTRQRQRGEQQYEKLAKTAQFHVVHEGQAKFYINLQDYLDTGLFLDHRLMRETVAQASSGKTVLNLFAYTCTASVHAALAGATSVTSVDLSNTYLAWGEKNFRLNNIALGPHEFIRADCIDWLSKTTETFDVIFIDPPTFSNSKRMEAHFDVQEDYVDLLHRALKRLTPGGILYFSNNYRRFKFDKSHFPNHQVEDISHKLLPEDFKRRPNIHHCWKLWHR